MRGTKFIVQNFFDSSIVSAQTNEMDMIDIFQIGEYW